MEISAWEIWWHPRRSARRLAELEEQAEDIDSLITTHNDLKRDYEKAQTDLALAAEENRRLVSESEASNLKLELLRTRNSELAEQNEEMKERIDTLSEELKLRKDAETQIQEFEKNLERIELMKQNYESRIQTLRKIISSLKEELHRSDEQNGGELAIIDMTPAGNENANRQLSAPSSPAEKSDDEWLERL